MWTGYWIRRFVLPSIFLMLMAMTMACSQQTTGPRAWIDAPVDGSSVPVGAPVPVIVHVFAPEGVAEVALSVNGTAYRRNPPTRPGDSFSDASLDWFPQQEGDYILQVTAYSNSGTAINARSVSIQAIGKTTPTPVGPTLVVITPGIATPVNGASDLAIVSVDAVVALYKGDTPVCDVRVVYRNAGTVPVPNDYIIQASLDGRPFATITRGAGFGVGGTSEATFAYQFTGTAYVGINLDSTNAVTESSETNNAFAEIRNCGGALPVITLVVPATPTRTPTVGIIQIQPPPTPTFTPTRTRTPTPHDTQGPPAPNLVSPKGTLSQCRTSVTLDWNPVSDPSGIKNYAVKWVREDGQSGGTVTTSTQHTISITCDNKSHTYTWSVQAEDNAGNRGATSSATFTNPAGLY